MKQPGFTELQMRPPFDILLQTKKETSMPNQFLKLNDRVYKTNVLDVSDTRNWVWII